MLSFRVMKVQSMRVFGSLLTAIVICLTGFVQIALPRTALAEERSVAERRRAQFQEQHQSHLLNLRHELSELSKQCHDQGLIQAAEDITSLSMGLTTPNHHPIFPQMVQLPISERLPQEQRAWRTRLQALREGRATELYSLARKALTRANLPTIAYDLIKDTLRLNPDHANARAVLGQKLFRDPAREGDPTYAGEWVSPFEARKRSGRLPEVNHPQFGWLPVRHVDRYEQGERLFRSKWVSVAKEKELRRDFRNAWEVQTEHFLVKTNTSLEEGVEISRKLEIFHEWLTTNFAAFFETPKSLIERFEDAQQMRRGGKPAAPMEVHYFATRKEYDRTVRAKSDLLKRIVTNGLYWEDDRISYFFRNPQDENLDVVYHEATHQIFDLATITDRRSASQRRKLELRERQTRPWTMCEKSNFWMLEGIACYFESVVINEGQISVGDPAHKRFVKAQSRLLARESDRLGDEIYFYVPFQTFFGLGREQFKNSPHVPQLYTQASGVAHFLMHYQEGVYRDDFVTLLSAVYRPDLRNVMKQPSFEEITGVKFAVLDQQYREHMGDMAIEVGLIQAARNNVIPPAQAAVSFGIQVEPE